MTRSYQSPLSSSNYSFQPVVKPSVFRPVEPNYRREPEGIETHKEPLRGNYDHSSEYDPYQSAAKQMQELLFGSNNSGYSDSLKPSTNSAFEKYIPSTADINTKLNSKSSFHNPYERSGLDSGNGHFGNRLVNFNPVVSSAKSLSSNREKSPKVARFCHECGNPFALPNIRFCCECGVKRLYC